MAWHKLLTAIAALFLLTGGAIGQPLTPYYYIPSGKGPSLPAAMPEGWGLYLSGEAAAAIRTRASASGGCGRRCDEVRGVC